MSTVGEVFGVSREVPLNYVTRESVDGEFINALSENKHIVVFGSSKQGKTSLRKYNLVPPDYIHVSCSNRMTLGNLHSAILKSLGYKVSGTTIKTTSGDLKIQAKAGGKMKIPLTVEGAAETGVEGQAGIAKHAESVALELDPTDVNEIIDALQKAECPQYIILEDFHYLPEDTQQDFAFALKSFHEDSSYTFVIVGVWLDENRLIQHNGDLDGRVISINADKWPPEKIEQVILDGERLLGVEFNSQFKIALMHNSFESIWVVQDACRRACEVAGVTSTRNPPVQITADANKMIKDSINIGSARYTGFLSAFSEGFRENKLEMYKWLVYCVLTSTVEELERGLGYSEIRQKIDKYHPEAPVNSGNITQALKSTASLQITGTKTRPIILDFDQTNRRLSVVDRSFLIWLQHQDRNELLVGNDLPQLDSGQLEALCVS